MCSKIGEHVYQNKLLGQTKDEDFKEHTTVHDVGYKKQKPSIRIPAQYWICNCSPRARHGKNISDKDPGKIVSITLKRYCGLTCRISRCCRRRCCCGAL